MLVSSYSMSEKEDMISGGCRGRIESSGINGTRSVNGFTVNMISVELVGTLRGFQALVCRDEITSIPWATSEGMKDSMIEKAIDVSRASLYLRVANSRSSCIY